MEKRKNPEKDLRKLSPLFFQIGLLMALMLCVSAFEYRTEVVEKPIDPVENTLEPEWMPPITDIKLPPPPKPKIANPIEVKEEEPDPPAEDIIIDMPDLGEIEIPDMPEAPDIEIAPSQPFLIVEEMPKPDGGFEAFYKFIGNNLKYPRVAKNLGIEGQVVVQFIVDETGQITHVEIVKGIGSGCDEEVLRVMAKAPNWNPGKQRGVPVRVKKVIPIFFRLN